MRDGMPLQRLRSVAPPGAWWSPMTGFQPDPFGFTEYVETSRPGRALSDSPVLPDKIEQCLEAYVPRKVSGDTWRLIRDLVLDAVRRSHPRSVSATPRGCTHTPRLSDERWTMRSFSTLSSWAGL